MNHSWQKIDKYNSVCKICGCKREQVSAGFKRSYYYYTRSHIHFGCDLPDCIDWEIENNKTID